MAYSTENEERKELVSIPKNNRGEYVVATLITNTKTNSQSLDIRQFYTDNKGDVLPTYKGVRVNAELAAELVKALLDALEPDELMDVAELIEQKSCED